MNRNEVSVSFADLADQAEGHNKKTRNRRFFPMQSYRNNKLHQFGMYDGLRKKYVLGEVNSQQAPALLSEIKQMISGATE